MSNRRIDVGGSQKFWGDDRTIYENEKSIGSIETNWLGLGKLVFKGKAFKLGFSGQLMSKEGKKLVKPRQQSVSFLPNNNRQLFEDVEAKQFYVFRNRCLIRSPEHYDPDANVPPSCIFDIGRRTFTVELLEDFPPHLALAAGFYIFRLGSID